MDIWNSVFLRLADLVALLSLELKWFWPVLRPKILPFLVTLSLLPYDLLVLIAIYVTGVYITDLGLNCPVFD